MTPFDSPCAALLQCSEGGRETGFSRLFKCDAAQRRRNTHLAAKSQSHHGVVWQSEQLKVGRIGSDLSGAMHACGS